MFSERRLHMLGQSSFACLKTRGINGSPVIRYDSTRLTRDRVNQSLALVRGNLLSTSQETGYSIPLCQRVLAKALDNQALARPTLIPMPSASLYHTRTAAQSNVIEVLQKMSSKDNSLSHKHARGKWICKVGECHEILQTAADQP